MESSSSSQPIPLERVQIQNGFWGARQEINRTATLPEVLHHLTVSGRLDALKLNWRPGNPNPPHVFWESDVAKWMEAASYSLMTHPDPNLEHRLEEIIALLAGAQQPDGYLNAYYTVVEPGKRWTNLRDKHELYCAGHLIEAAVAHFETTGKTNFLEIARRYADYISAIFGNGPGQIQGYCGHPEIELALIRLWKVTGENRYLDLSRFFVEQRGQPPRYFELEAKARGESPQAPVPPPEYNQSHLPVREQTRAVGHCVRALHLYCAMADLARETGDATLLQACQSLWESIYQKQVYITGGLGASRHNEGFTADYDLPNETAYAETCAAIANVFFNHRLLRLHCHSRYSDEIERAIYNGLLSGISLDGRAFFYANPLALIPGQIKPDDPYYKEERSGWFKCACCPPNIPRFIASLGALIYSESPESVAVHQYATSQAEAHVHGIKIIIAQETDYPWKGKISLRITPETPIPFQLALRFPGWCREFSLRVNGEKTSIPPENGYLPLHRLWSPGDQVVLHLAMPVERIYSHPRIRANSGRIALRRGPLIYCLEAIDLPEAELDSISLPRHSEILAVHEKTLLGGITTLRGEAFQETAGTQSQPLYQMAPPPIRRIPFKAIPYFCWANRGPTGMQIWIREAFNPLPQPPPGYE
jgi:uncharacterized protein